MRDIILVGGVTFYVVNIGMLAVGTLVCGWRVLRDARQRFVVIKMEDR